MIENRDFITDYNSFILLNVLPKFDNAICIVEEEHQLNTQQIEFFRNDAWNELRPIKIETIIDN